MESISPDTMLVPMLKEIGSLNTELFMAIKKKKLFLGW